MEEGCAGVLLILMTVAAMILMGATAFGKGYDDAMTSVACPALLTNSSSLADSLAIATKYPQCEWWSAPSVEERG